MKRVVIVTVTYGDRRSELAAMLDAVDRLAGGDAIVATVVVDNGAAAATRSMLAGREVEVVSLGSNRGSAIGFGAGIARGLEIDADYMWLLDDDNCPEPSALTELLAAAETYGASSAFQCMRPSYEPLRRLAAGTHPQDVFGHPNGFLGESLRHRLGAARRLPRQTDDAPQMPWAMFGGFFAPVEAFAAAGEPRRDYVIYADDSEYTHRISAAGWRLRLLPKAVVEDVDEAWWEVAGERRGVTSAVTPRVQLAEERRRMYYTVRNSVHFERSQRVTNRFEYAVNMVAKHLVMTVVCCLSAAKTRRLTPLRNLVVYLRASWHGFAGRLGILPLDAGVDAQLSPLPAGPADPSVAVVTVTYGDRGSYLMEVLAALQSIDDADRIEAIIVVDNGASADTRRLLAAHTDDRVAVVERPENSGSAEGYAAGIARATTEDVDFVWLLDDDNRPEQRALAELVNHAVRKDGDVALQSLRPSYDRVARFASSGGGMPVYEAPDTFGSYLRRLLGRLGLSTRRGGSRELPFATFGGFFASRAAFMAAGLPRADFVMYADDTEYTHRFPKNGTPIHLVPESVVIDIDTAWWRAREGSVSPIPHLSVKEPEDLRRMYYTIRNSVYFESTERVSNRLRYRMILASKHVALGSMTLLACVRHRTLQPFRAFRTYLQATADGLAGRLGQWNSAEERLS
ncbi:MAG: glycosyltransferase [Acidimicrobiia bacterium]